MSAIERFKAIAAEERFKGWPLEGEYTLGHKIPFFGQVLEYKLKTDGGVKDYYSILRDFGWAVVFGVTPWSTVPTLVQWKPGVNRASWELPPGGIGKVDPDATAEEILQKTQEVYLRETGYGGGRWQYLGYVLIESGKYRGPGPDNHGLSAHLLLATDLEREADARRPQPEEIMETLEVSLNEFREVLASGLFVECSAVACAYMALGRLG